MCGPFLFDSVSNSLIVMTFPHRLSRYHNKKGTGGRGREESHPSTDRGAPFLQLSSPDPALSSCELVPALHLGAPLPIALIEVLWGIVVGLLQELRSIPVRPRCLERGFQRLQPLLEIRSLFSCQLMGLGGVCDSLGDGVEDGVGAVAPGREDVHHLRHLARFNISSYGEINFQLLELLVELALDDPLVNAIYDQVLQLSDIGDVELL